MATKIERLKLVNFKGIMKGLGLKEIELDFTKTDKRLILLLGGNGKGKTTIQSMLHPFSSSFDNRKTLIIDGTVGKKEIDIRMDDFLYKIIHQYSNGKNKSFITKVLPDGTIEDLNPAGTVRNFTAIVEEELGINENFFKLIKIGSQAVNFIDLNASDRKDFIGEFTPDISDYLNAHSTVTSKYSSTNKEIKFINDELHKLENPETIEKNITLQKSLILTNKEKTSKLMVERDKLNGLLENNISLENLNALKPQLAKTKKD
jgi:hypothetical protein